MKVASRLRWLLPGVSWTPALAAHGRGVVRAPFELLAELTGRQHAESLSASRTSHSSGTNSSDPSPPLPAEHSPVHDAHSGVGARSTGAVVSSSISNAHERLIRRHPGRHRRQRQAEDGTTELTAKIQRIRESVRQAQDTAATGSGGTAPAAVAGGNGCAVDLVYGNGLDGSGSRPEVVDAGTGGGESRSDGAPALHWRRAATAGTGAGDAGGAVQSGRSALSQEPVRRRGAAVQIAAALGGTSTGVLDSGPGASDGVTRSDPAAAPRPRAGLEDVPYGRSSTGSGHNLNAEQRAGNLWADGPGRGSSVCTGGAGTAAAVTSLPAAAVAPGSHCGDDGDDGELEAGSAAALDTAGAAAAAAAVRIIRADSGGSLAAVAANRDADLLRRIAELQNLRDAELLVYDAGMGLRSFHAAELLARLPELDLQTSNAGPRTRRLLRFLSRSALRDLQPVPGPTLARCVAAFARLHYAPPESVAPLSAALTAASARKLRACAGAELADLAWALACLEQLYGNMHQAVRQPAHAARLAPNARIVGYVRAGGGSTAGAANAAEEVEGVRAQGLVDEEVAEAAAGREAVPAAAETFSKPGRALLAAVSETSGGVTPDGGGEFPGGSTAASGAAAAASDEQQGNAAVHECLARSATPAAVAAYDSSRGVSASDGKGGGGDGAVPATRQQVPELVWLVPRAMGRIWERLALAAEASAEQGRMGGEQLAKVAWAYARVGRADKRLYDKLAAAVQVHLEPFLEKAQTAAAAAAPPLWQRNSRRRHGSGGGAAALARGPPPLDATSVTNLAWAFVAVGRRDPQLLAALAAVASSYTRMYDNDQMATLARSYAGARHYNEALAAAFVKVVLRRHRHLSGPQLVALLSSLAALRHRNDELAGPGLARAVWDKRQELSAEQVCELLWASAQLGLDVRHGAGGPGMAVLGLSPATAASAAAAETVAPPKPQRRGSGAAIGGGGGGGGGGAAAVALLSALRGRCDGLPPTELAQALWAVALLPLPTEHRGELRTELVSELRQQLVRHPVASYSREALLQLYTAAHVLGPGMLPAAPMAMAVADSAVASGNPEFGPVGTTSLYDAYGNQFSDTVVEVEDERAGALASAPASEAGGIGAPPPGNALAGCHRVQLFGQKAAVEVAASQRMYGTDADATAAAADMTAASEGEPQEQRQPGVTASDEKLQQQHHQRQQQQRPPERQQQPALPPPGQDHLVRRSRGRRSDGSGGALSPRLGQAPAGDDGQWADVDWGRIRVAVPPAADAGPAASPPTQPPLPSPPVGTDPRDTSPPRSRARRAGKRAFTAATVPSLPSHEVRKVYDEASGRELWEVVPRGRDGDGDGDRVSRVLPPELLAACRSAAAEWAQEERQRLEAVEGEDEELWRLDVAAALWDLTAVEPQQRWVTRNNTAIADLLVLSPPQPPPPPSTCQRQRQHGVAAGLAPAAAAPPPPPLAVLLVDAAQCTRNPPYLPLGSVRMRQLLLEAAGAKVLVVPHFLWRMVGDSPDEQICLLANLLGGRQQ